MTYNGVPTEPDDQWRGMEAAVVNLSLNGACRPDRSTDCSKERSRGRSQSLVVKTGKNVLMPEVGTASEVALAVGDMGQDDMYIEGLSLRRGFASEFVAMLEVGTIYLVRFSTHRRFSSVELASFSDTVPNSDVSLVT